MVRVRSKFVAAGGGVLAVALGVLAGAVTSPAPGAEIRYDIQPQFAAFADELVPQAVTVPDVAIAIDTDAIIELNNLLRAFIPVAQTHDISFDYNLQTDLQRHSERHGIHAPVLVHFADADFGAQLSAVYLPEDAAALAEDLTGATEAWITKLATTPTVQRISAAPFGGEDEIWLYDLPAADIATRGFAATLDARTGSAPASRAGARAGQPVTTRAVRELSAEFDDWLSNEEVAARDAAINRIADFRARMVAISRLHGNGRLPAEILCPIPFSPRFTMRCDVIPSLVDLNSAFRAHFGRDLVVRSGYRGNPGTSNHGWGLAVDFGGQMVNFGTSEFNWMMANARQFGWGHAFWAVPGGINPQPWHWEAMDQIREMTGVWR